VVVVAVAVMMMVTVMAMVMLMVTITCSFFMDATSAPRRASAAASPPSGMSVVSSLSATCVSVVW
jgi:hypothetical protein